MGLDAVADQQRLVLLVGAQPLGHGLVVPLGGEARKVARAERAQVAGAEVVQDAVADQRRDMG
jgi:hypothetical protein